MKDLQNERENDEAIDELEGCRSGANTIKPKRERTGGIFCISTLSGFIIYLKEYIHRETPTEVISDAVKAFSELGSNINYFERLEALGYDNMCNLQARIHNAGKNDEMNDKEAYFWSELYYRTFVDGFHMKTHKCELCDKDHEKGICCFDTTLPKFKEIMTEYENYCKEKRMKYTKINDEVKFENFLLHKYKYFIFFRYIDC